MSKLTNRRDLLKVGLGAAAVAAAPTALLAQEEQRAIHAITTPDFSLKTFQTDMAIEEEEVPAAIEYYRQVCQQNPHLRTHHLPRRQVVDTTNGAHCAAPIIQDLWTPAVEFVIPEPKIDRIHRMVTGGWLGWQRGQKICAAITRQMHLIPPGVTVVEKLPPFDPVVGRFGCRALSNCFRMDAEETDFGPRTTAMALVKCVAQVWAVWRQSLQSCPEPHLGRVWVKEPHLGWAGVKRCEVLPVQITTKLDGYTLEMKAWSTGVGYYT